MFFAHLGLLFIPLGWALNNKRMRTSDHVLATLILGWTSLVLTGYVVSIFGKLGSQSAYLLTNIVIILPLSRMIRSKLPLLMSDFDFVTLRAQEKKINTLFVLSFLGVIAGALLVCVFYLPNNPDAEAYRIPRVYMYRDHGSLSHYTTGIDVRMLFYPLNGVLSHMIVAVHKVDAHWMHLFTFLSWAFSSLACYAVARRLKASVSAAFFAAFITISTPEIYCLATAGNDEVLAGFPMFCALYFFLAWHQSKYRFFAILGVLGACISVGVKEHYVFYWFFFILLGVHFSRQERRKEVLSFVKKRKIFIGFALMALGASAFVHKLINYFSSGQSTTNIGEHILNYSANPLVAIQNVILYALQMFLSPLPDLWPRADLTFLIRLYEKFQHYFNFLVTWVWRGSTFESPYDPFRGLLIAEAPFRTEATIWFGFVPCFWLLSLVMLRKVKAWTQSLAPWLVASFFFWMIAFAAMIKFQYTVQSYFTYAALFGMPGVAVAYDAHVKLSRIFSLLFRLSLWLLFLTNLLFCFNILRDNKRRNLQSVRASHFEKQRPDLMKTETIEFLKLQSRLHFVATHWEVPYLSFIAKNPQAQFSISPEFLNSSSVPSLGSFQAFAEYGNFPLRLTEKVTNGFGAIGSYHSTYGPENVFCKGGAELRCQDTWIVLNSEIFLSETELKIKFSNPARGESPVDDLQYRFRVTQDTTEQKVVQSAWLSLMNKETFAHHASGNFVTGQARLRVEVKKKSSQSLVGIRDFVLKRGFENSSHISM